jgi:hypothetical protein
MRDTARLSHESRSVSLNLAIHHLILRIVHCSRCPFWHSLGNSRWKTNPLAVAKRFEEFALIETEHARAVVPHPAVFRVRV